MNQLKAIEFVKGKLEMDYDDDFLSDILNRVIEDMNFKLISDEVDSDGMRTRVELLYQKRDMGYELEEWEKTVLFMDSQKGGCYY